MFNEYVVLQVMYAGMKNNTPEFIVEFVKEEDYKKEDRWLKK